MAISFDDALRLYQEDKIDKLASSPSGLRFLLLKTLDRPEYAAQLIEHAGLDSTPVAAKTRLRNLFASPISNEDLTNCIAEIYKKERKARKGQEKQLVAELYKMKAFDWGGLHQNSLEKTIVDNYVKKITQFDILNERIDNELLVSMRGYVQCSWYNHWTSILVEDLFKDQPGVVPAVGLIKKVDFFVHGQPFDLKVTYLPEGYIKEKRRLAHCRPELGLLKSLAKQKGICFDAEQPEGRLLEQLWLMMGDTPDKNCRAAVDDLKAFRIKLLAEVQANPEELICWLYENQGIRRFDSSNRLFLVLVNTSNFFESWKLKRAHSLLAERIAAFISSRNGHKIGKEVQFTWEGKHHSATADLLVIEHST